MKVNISCCLFVLDSEKNINIRKNDIKTIKVLVNENKDLPRVEFVGDKLKMQIKKEIASITGTSIFHLEQVYTTEYKNEIDIIYLGVTNIENIKKIKNGYKLVDFKISNNEAIKFDNEIYNYKTCEIEENNNIEYFHEIKVKDEELKRNLLELLVCFKKIRANLDQTDIIFKFFGKTFTLEDVRIVYEMIKECNVDKSNFRKKIIKYCEKTEEKSDVKNGFRPSQKYSFKPIKEDAWI